MENRVTDLEIGSLNGGSSFADGLLDEVFVIDKELTPSEITDLYNNGWTLPNGTQEDNQTSPPVVTETLQSDLEYGVCHTADGKRQIFFFLVLLSFVVLALGIVFNLAILTFIGSAMLLMMSFYVIPCIIIIGRLFMFVAILMLAYSVFIQPRKSM